MVVAFQLLNVLQRIVVYLLGIPHILTILVCTYLKPQRFFLKLLMYILCLPIH